MHDMLTTMIGSNSQSGLQSRIHTSFECVVLYPVKIELSVDSQCLGLLHIYIVMHTCGRHHPSHELGVLSSHQPIIHQAVSMAILLRIGPHPKANCDYEYSTRNVISWLILYAVNTGLILA